MNIPDLDFKLLFVFQALMRYRKVSAVAEELDISQPTISRCLGRLREHFKDPLFVRTHHGMDPTPRALTIADTVSQILELYHAELVQASQFDPQASKRNFKVAASDIGHLVVIPRLIKTLEVTAPGIRVTAVPLGFKAMINELETGEVDLALGAFPKLYAGVYEQSLYTEHYVCMVRGDHPFIQDRITEEEFKQAQHVIVSAYGLGHVHQQIEKKLLQVCPSEKVRIVSHSFLVSALLIEQSDFILTIPSRVAETIGRSHNLRTLQSPIELPNFNAKLYWHERFHREPANQWLRRTIASFFKEPNISGESE